MKIEVKDLNGKVVGEETLESPSSEVNPHLLYLVDKYQKSVVRQGTASSKTRAEVSGGGAKPYRQKGTGNARRGSNRTPLRRGGGVSFGPKPRDFSIKINNVSIKLALLTSLNDKLTADRDNIFIFQNDNRDYKTKDFSKLTGSNKTTFVVSSTEESLIKGVRNIKNVSIFPFEYIPIDKIRTERVIFSNEAFKNLKEKVFNNA